MTLATFIRLRTLSEYDGESCIDYKILTEVLAMRLEKVLPKIKNPDQTGYVKGRYIGENIGLIQDLMFYLEKENSPGIAVFVDFRKAFDSIEWNYLEKALALFNFGPIFLQWFKTIYSNISSCVLNNGHASHFFPLTRGVRQGCPLSGLLFVIGLDLLARAIITQDRINGIIIGNQEVKTTMYADDTTVCLRDSESISHLIKLLDQFKLFPVWKLMPPKLKRCGLASGKTDVTLRLISVGPLTLFVP